MKINSIVTKTLTLTSLVGIGMSTFGATANTAQAAIVKNDAKVYTVNENTNVYKDYDHYNKTGQVLPANTSWKIIKTAYDKDGYKWYDLGKDQWVKVENATTAPAVSTEQTQTNYSTQNTLNSGANTSTYTVQQPAQQTVQQSATTQAPVKQTSQVSSYTSSTSGSEASAKAWIAQRESGGSYTARNSQYIGKYQLSSSLLKYGTSPAGQEKAADEYVHSRYGSWNAAKSHWLSSGWY